MCVINRGLALREMILNLIAYGYSFSDKRALEMFGGRGTWHLHELIKFINPVLFDICEIRSDFSGELKEKFPHSNILNLDSLSYCQNESALYELIIIDNPQGVYGPVDSYCEHFEAIVCALNIASDSVLIIFNINILPFDLEKNPNWLKARKDFYSLFDLPCIDDKGCLDVENIENFYRLLLKKYGYSVKKFHMYSRFSDHRKSLDYLHYGFISASKC